MSDKILTDSGVSRLSTNVKNYVNKRIACVTQSEYDALPIATKTNGTVYFIKDSIPQWSTASDAEIVQAIADADAGLIDLYSDYGWRVGDERVVPLSAIAASGTFDGVTWSVNETHEDQNCVLVLMDAGSTSETGNLFDDTAASDYQLVTAVKNKDGSTRTNPAFLVGMKNVLSKKTGSIIADIIEHGYMNPTSTIAGSWGSCARRNWCNGAFRQAIPSSLRSIFKQMNVITALGYGESGVQTVQDYFALWSGKEVFGNDDSNEPYWPGGAVYRPEWNALKQVEYYKTPAHRFKLYGEDHPDTGQYNTGDDWWERSISNNGFDPVEFGNAWFNEIHSKTDETIGKTGQTFMQDASYSRAGFSPFGCI